MNIPARADALASVKIPINTKNFDILASYVVTMNIQAFVPNLRISAFHFGQL